MKRWLWRNWPRRWDFKTRYFQSSNSAYYFCFLSISNPVQFKDFNSVAEEDYNNYLAGHVVNSFTHATHQDGQVDREHVNTEFISSFSNFQFCAQMLHFYCLSGCCICISRLSLSPPQAAHCSGCICLTRRPLFHFSYDPPSVRGRVWPP